MYAPEKQDPTQTRELDILRRESARNGKITETYMTGLRVMKMIAAKLSFVAHNNKPNGMDWNKAAFILVCSIVIIKRLRLGKNYSLKVVTFEKINSYRNY